LGFGPIQLLIDKKIATHWTKGEVIGPSGDTSTNFSCVLSGYQQMFDFYQQKKQLELIQDLSTGHPI